LLFQPFAALAEPMPPAKQAGLLRLAVQEYGEGVGSDGRVAAPAEIAIAEEILEVVGASAPSPELARIAELVAERASADAVAEAFGAWMTVHGADIQPPLPAILPSVAAGQRLFERYCTACHGSAADGRGELAGLIGGSPPANFTDPGFMSGETPGEFFQAISFGVPGTAMPQWEAVLGDAERWDLIAYLWTVRGGKPFPSTLAECQQCHGPGASATDLTVAGALISLSDAEIERRLAERSDHAKLSGRSTAEAVTIARWLGFAADAEVANAAAPQLDVRHVARALDLIASEYRTAVSGRAVIDAVDYAEAQLFLGRLTVDLNSLVSMGRISSDPRFAAEIARIQKAMLEKADPADVERAVAALSSLLLPQLGLEQAEQAEVAAVLALVDRAEQEAADSPRAAAERLLEGYMAFEPVERRIAALDPELAARLEGAFTRARAELLANRSAEAEFAVLREGLARTGERFAAPASGYADFVTSFLIMLREGLEAILVISALIAYVTRAGHEKARAWLYWGAVVGIGASLATAVALEMVIGGLGLGKEVLEGATMLVAAVVLFSVSYWLISRVEARHWQEYIQGRLNRALGTGSSVALAGASFLAVYREGFETALFYRALSLNAASMSAVAAGFVLGCVALFALFVGITRYSVRIPIRPFFTGTGILLYVLAFRFLGAGIAELQSAGTLPLTPVGWWPDLPLLDMAGNLETALAQLAMVVAAVAAAVVIATASRVRSA
jgi:high-affinity iron transporter